MFARLKDLKFRDLVQNPDPPAVHRRLDENGRWVRVALDFRPGTERFFDFRPPAP